MRKTEQEIKQRIKFQKEQIQYLSKYTKYSQLKAQLEREVLGLEWVLDESEE